MTDTYVIMILKQGLKKLPSHCVSSWSIPWPGFNPDIQMYIAMHCYSLLRLKRLESEFFEYQSACTELDSHNSVVYTSITFHHTELL